MFVIGTFFQEVGKAVTNEGGERVDGKSCHFVWRGQCIEYLLGHSEQVHMVRRTKLFRSSPS